MPNAIAISPPAMRAIFNNRTVNVISTAHATNMSPRIIIPNPTQRFMNLFISLSVKELKNPDMLLSSKPNSEEEDTPEEAKRFGFF